MAYPRAFHSLASLSAISVGMLAARAATARIRSRGHELFTSSPS